MRCLPCARLNAGVIHPPTARLCPGPESCGAGRNGASSLARVFMGARMLRPRKALAIPASAARFWNGCGHSSGLELAAACGGHSRLRLRTSAADGIVRFPGCQDQHRLAARWPAGHALAGRAGWSRSRRSDRFLGSNVRSGAHRPGGVRMGLRLAIAATVVSRGVVVRRRRHHSCRARKARAGEDRGGRSVGRGATR